MSRMSAEDAEHQIRIYAERNGVAHSGIDEALAVDDFQLVGTFIANDRDWILQGNLPTHLQAEQSQLLASIDLFQARYFEKLDIKRDPLTNTITYVGVTKSGEQKEREREKARKAEMKAIQALSAAQIEEYYQKAQQLEPSSIHSWDLRHARGELLESYDGAKSKQEKLKEAQKEFGDAQTDLRTKVVRFKNTLRALDA